MNYSVYRGIPSSTKRLGFLGIFGRKFKRNANYKYYKNVYLFRSGSFVNVDLSEKKNPYKEFISNSIESLKKLRERLVVEPRKQIGVAVSMLAILVVLNGVVQKNTYFNNYNKDEVSITDKIDTFKTMRSALVNSVYNEEENVYRLSK